MAENRKQGDVNMVKRLFIFAGYNRDGIIDNTLVDYLNFLSPLGDIILTMDSDVPAHELKKLKSIPNLLSVAAARHGEYDFGSYKRGLKRAGDTLKKYDWVYLVNDSVYCISSPRAALEKLESSRADYVGMIGHYDDTQLFAGYNESWFIGFNKKIMACNFIQNLISGVTHRDHKWEIVARYEKRIGTLVTENGFRHTCLINQIDELTAYTAPIETCGMGLPFVKKRAMPYVQNKYDLLQFMDGEIYDNIKHNIGKQKRKYPYGFRFKLFNRIPLFYIERSFDGTIGRMLLFGRIPVAVWRHHKK